MGVPVVTIGLWYAMHGSLRGRIVWLGGFAYMTYMWATIGLQVTFNEFFLGYVVLFGLSLFTLVSGVATTDVNEIRGALEGRVSTSVYGGFLLLIALGLAVLWLSDIAPALLGGTVPTLVEEAGQ